MHDDFVILDGATVWTGSWPYSETGTYKNNDNALVFNSAEIAAAYQDKFDGMFVHKEFGTRALASKANLFTVAGIPVEIYFSPADNVLPHLLDYISSAKSSIRILAFTFTNEELETAIVRQKMNQQGINVQGIFETRGSDFGLFNAFYCGKADVRLDANPYSMHHKVIIIDNAVVITGSLNFTNSAFEANDENIVIVNDPRLAEAYNQEFDRLWAITSLPSDITCPSN